MNDSKRKPKSETRPLEALVMSTNTMWIRTEIAVPPTKSQHEEFRDGDGWRQSEEVLAYLSKDYGGNYEKRLVTATYITTIEREFWVYATADADAYNGDVPLEAIKYWCPLPEDPLV